MNDTIQGLNSRSRKARSPAKPSRCARWPACLAVIVLLVGAAVAQSQYGGMTGTSPSPNNGSGGYVGSFHVDDKYASFGIDPKYPVDPGTTSHTINDFRPESRDIFHLMDQTADAHGNLKPMDFSAPQPEDQNNPAQQAIYGRNTWMMWCGGDEYFWDWLSQDAYGVLDFLRMLDSRKRESRFRDLGLINQPGLCANAKPGPYGLYLDMVDRRIGEGEGFSPYRGSKPNRSVDPNALESDGVNPAVYGYPSGVIGLRLFPNPGFTTNRAAQKWWNAEAFYKDPNYARDPRTVRPFLVGMSCALCHVAAHPLNPPANPEEPEWSNLSSLIGNQYFRTSAAFGSSVDRANFLWFYLASQQPGTIDTSMVTPDHINNANAMNAIFELPSRLARAQLNPAETQDEEARSFPGDGDKERLVPRVLMDGADSIGVFGALARVYLNIGMYHEEWNRCANPVIGFVPQKPFSIEASRHNSVYWRVNENFRVAYLAQFLAWDRRQTKAGQCSTVAMRLKDARVPLEDLAIQAIAKGDHQEVPPKGASLFVVKEEGDQVKIRIFAGNGDMVIDKDATELAADLDPALGMEKTNQLQILRGLFADGNIHGKLDGDLKRIVAGSVMELADYTPKFVDLPENQHHWNEALALKGSQVFTRNCMICHSSKQPEGFAIQFAHDPSATATNWAAIVAAGNKLTLPLEWENWELFKTSPAYKGYVSNALAMVGDGDAAKLEKFVDENYFSTDLRIPVSLTETPSGRALGTNGKDHQVWAEFTSATYRSLPPVGKIHYFDPFAKQEKTFQPDGNGPGYYRPASLVSVWATAPLLHNNALGLYLPDAEEARRVSVEGRLVMFDDAIEKLLWKDKRGLTPSGECGLRDPTPGVWRGSDPGWIFRTDVDSELRIPQGHLRHLVTGVLPGFIPARLCPTVVCLLDHPWIIPLLLALFSACLIRWWPIAYFYLLTLTGLAVLIVIPLLGLEYLLPVGIWLVPVGLVVGGVLWVYFGTGVGQNPAPSSPGAPRRSWAWLGVGIHVAFIFGIWVALWGGREFVDGHLGDLRVGPLPKGMPVNALMNLNPDAGLPRLIDAVRGLVTAIGKLRADDARPTDRRLGDDARLAIFEKYAGPALMKASKCPDFVLDRGHYFGEALSDPDKRALIAFLKTL